MTGADAGRDSEPDVVNRLNWGLRRYSAVVVLAVILAVGLSLLLPVDDSDEKYEAAALVVATTLEIEPLQLPRTVDAVFKSGSVAESVASQLPQAGPAHLLIPDVIRLVPLNDTIVVRVIGRNRQPTVAANLANVAALSLVAELNRLGSGIGQFALQDRARPPPPREAGSALLAPVAIGVVSGGAMGLGIVGLLLLIRRPVIGGDEAAAVVGAPLLVSLELPRRKRRVVLESVSGLSLVSRQLFPAGQRLCALVGTGADTRLRLKTMGLVARLLSRTQDVSLVVPVPDRRALADMTRSVPNIAVSENWAPAQPGQVVPTAGDESTLVLFGLSVRKFDVPQVLPAGTRSLLFVARGVRRAELERAAGQFGPGGVDGVVFVRRSSRWRRRRGAGRRGSVSGGAPAGQPADASGTVRHVSPSGSDADTGTPDVAVG